jgi:hypothetical protein
VTVYGLPVPDLPEGWTPLRTAVVVECLDVDGTVGLAYRYSDDLPAWAALGMLVAFADGLRSDLAEATVE